MGFFDKKNFFKIVKNALVHTLIVVLLYCQIYQDTKKAERSGKAEYMRLLLIKALNYISLILADIAI